MAYNPSASRLLTPCSGFEAGREIEKKKKKRKEKVICDDGVKRNPALGLGCTETKQQPESGVLFKKKWWVVDGDGGDTDARKRKGSGRSGKKKNKKLTGEGESAASTMRKRGEVQIGEGRVVGVGVVCKSPWMAPW